MSQKKTNKTIGAFVRGRMIPAMTFFSLADVMVFGGQEDYEDSALSYEDANFSVEDDTELTKVLCRQWAKLSSAKSEMAVLVTQSNKYGENIRGLNFTICRKEMAEKRYQETLKETQDPVVIQKKVAELREQFEAPKKLYETSRVGKLARA